MPRDETRRLLKTFGVAVTTCEDKVTGGAPENEVRAAQDEARALLREITALLDRLRADAEARRGGAGA